MRTLPFPHTPADAPYVGLLPGFSRDRYYQGFPSFRHHQFQFTKRNAGVKVFNFPSKEESIVLTLKNETVRSRKKGCVRRSRYNCSSLNTTPSFVQQSPTY